MLSHIPSTWSHAPFYSLVDLLAPCFLFPHTPTDSSGPQSFYATIQLFIRVEKTRLWGNKKGYITNRL